MDTIDQLSILPMFQGLPREQLHGLSAIVILQTFERGESIFFEGEEAHGFYIATSGRIKIFKISFEGKEQTLHLFGPGEPFGEVPVFAGKKYPANAEALEKSTVLYFPRQKFIDLVKSTPQLALNMLAVLSQRLHMFAALIEELSLKEVPARLARYLLYLSEKHGMANEVTLDISKTQLSSLLGTIPETLSRILARMTAEGIITSKGTATVTLEDQDVLEKLASGESKLSKK